MTGQKNVKLNNKVTIDEINRRKREGKCQIPPPKNEKKDMCGDFLKRLRWMV